MTEVRLEGLRKAFGGVPALAGLDLEVRSGELLTLLGPSGCGKSTTLRLIAGLDAPDAGAVVLDGRDVTALRPQDRDVGLVFQSYALFPHLNVAANVGFGLSVRGVGRDEVAARVAAMLRMVRLEGLADRHPAQLSGGQRQRAALARTLVTEPAVLMLDEPLANLDAGLRAEMRALIRRLQRRLGITTILVTHDQQEALEVSDRVAVMLDGRVAQLAAPEALWRRPATLAVARFLGAANLVPARLTAPDRAETALGPVALTPRDGLGAGARVHLMLRGEGLELDPAGPLRGTVAERRFAGPTVAYDVALPGGRLTLTRTAGDLLAPGDPVALRIDPAQVWVLDRTECEEDA